MDGSVEPMDLSENLEMILEVIEKTRGDSDRFAERLRHKRIPHLSFSQITAVEFCEQRYFLQYVKLMEPTPTPEYFTKGKVIHQLIARNYLKAANHREVSLGPSIKALERQYQGETLTQLTNTMIVHLENFWEDCEVVAVEKPFAMTLQKDLPPCVGVIDLILKKEDGYILVDHKTGRDFYPQDELQMAIYMRFIQQEFGTTNCKFYYDSYRWVNNLKRIRKPAFVRTYVAASGNWRASLQRIKEGYQTIKAIHEGKYARKEGKCFMCPYRSNCW